MDKIITQLYVDLQSQTQIVHFGEEGWYLISLPFLGKYNDCIEILVKEEGENILVVKVEDCNLGVLEDKAIKTTKDKFANVVLDLIQVWG